MTSLSVLFGESGSDIVSWEGRSVRALFRVQVEDGDRLRVNRLTVTRARPQALMLALEEGEFQVGDKHAPTIALWSTTSPRDVTIRISSPGPTTVDLWNGWSYGGVEHAWIGNAGLVAQSVDRGYTLQFSDGIGEVDFTDLVVRLEHLPSGTT